MFDNNTERERALSTNQADLALYRDMTGNKDHDIIGEVNPTA